MIGGSSASGKTELSKLLSRHYRVNRILADDVRIAMEAVVTKTNPIYNFDEDDQITEMERAKYPESTKEEVSKEVCKGLENIIHHHIIVNDPVIIEGDDILPEFALERQQYEPKVKSIFLYNDKLEIIQNNLISRNRMVNKIDAIEIATNLLNQNLEIRDKAQSLGLNVLKAFPYETLFDRVRTLLD